MAVGPLSGHSDKQYLQKRVSDLERQLAEARAVLQGVRLEQDLEPQWRFEQVFAHSRDIILFIRYEDGSILEANPAALQAYGYSRAELLGLTIHALRAPHDRQQTRAQLEKANIDGILFETVHQRKDGSTFPVEVSSQGVTLEGERKLISIIRDITERRQAEDKFAWVFQFNPAAMSITRMADAAYTDANESFCQMTGYTREEIIGHTSVELGFFPEESRAAVVRQFQNDGLIHQQEFQLTAKNGQQLWVLLSLDPIRISGEPSILVTMIDITRPKQVQEALRASEEHFRQLADAMPQLVWTARADGSVDYYNQRYQEYRGLVPVQDTWEWSPGLHPDDLQPTVDAWSQAVATGATYQIEHRVRMADDSYRWHLSRGVPVRDAAGQAVRWYGTATDIHDQKLAEEQLRLFAERLEISNHALQDFAYLASHDLQEPLRKIEAFGAALLENTSQMNEKQRNYLERMQSAAGRLRDMVDGLLQLSRIDTQGQPFVPVLLSAVAAEVLSDLDFQIRHKGGEVEVGELPMVTGDPVQLHQLLQNLIGNGLKFHREGVPPRVRVSAHRLAGGIQIQVEDNGIGFNLEDVERMFQPFQRLVGRSQYEGSGMGLAICRKIVERHNGTIAAKSEPEKGSIFLITLPTKIEQLAAPRRVDDAL